MGEFTEYPKPAPAPVEKGRNRRRRPKEPEGLPPAMVLLAALSMAAAVFMAFSTP
ncbi:MAG: hypothetical protein ACE5FN_06420 [Leptospirillia bacterium]